MEEKFWKERRRIYEFIGRKWTGRELKGWKHECMRWWVDEVSEGLFLQTRPFCSLLPHL